MKSLQISALMLALSMCSIAAHAQQEIDPDHFDRPAATAAHVKSSKGSAHKTAARNQANMKLATRHSRDAHQKHARHA